MIFTTYKLSRPFKISKDKWFIKKKTHNLKALKILNMKDV